MLVYILGYVRFYINLWIKKKELTNEYKRKVFKTYLVDWLTHVRNLAPIFWIHIDKFAFQSLSIHLSLRSTLVRLMIEIQIGRSSACQNRAAFICRNIIVNACSDTANILWGQTLQRYKSAIEIKIWVQIG